MIKINMVLAIDTGNEANDKHDMKVFTERLNELLSNYGIIQCFYNRDDYGLPEEDDGYKETTILRNGEGELVVK